MKKIFVIVMCLALAAVAVACVATAAPSTSVPATPDDGEPISSGDNSVPLLPKVIVHDELPPIADTAMYRGTVISADTTAKDANGNPAVNVVLKQAEGTNFGAPQLQFTFVDDTRIAFPLETLVSLEGKYLEVYYSYATRNAPDADELYEVLVAECYEDEAMYNFNGTVAEIVPHPDKEGEGRLLMNDMSSDNGFQVYYLYGPDTQFYVNFDEIQVGDKLNIFHSPAMAMSMPPQSAAWEIRPYNDGAVRCGVE